ncbi:hypothetical protein ISN45_At01g000130 [Arabidopsis thaliana x Arabidopsis arenosa]|uniref:Uncharacterized protein n=2 Tax=Arabidopsis TaxID=3701 RepID=A0A8T2GY28_ARASU|nr:hypothetical protein ISN45_At01g000130 [Arabidopsis thaliana x Arabidopsis arenosa]KAG7652651.1 hypothetical protein ISN44_As01g000080 [Arabidopsis suecica]
MLISISPLIFVIPVSSDVASSDWLHLTKAKNIIYIY